MSDITLKDIGLKDYTLDTMPRLKRLRGKLLRTQPRICIERARFITQYMREASSNQESMQTKYARAVNHFLSNKAPLFFDDNLLAGTTTSKPYGAPVYPEFTGCMIWPELNTVSRRRKNPLIISPTDIEILNSDIFPFWMKRNILEHTREKYGNPECMKLSECMAFFIASKAVCISHTVPDYGVALDKGVEYIIHQAVTRRGKIRRLHSHTEDHKQKLLFYQAVQIAMEGVIAYARHLSDKASDLAESEQDSLRKEELQTIADICARVPAKPAQTFREAISTIWLIHTAIHAENINMAISPGRLDQVLYRYYRQDIDCGRLTVENAVELVGCLWLKLNDNTNLVPEASEELFGGAGTVPAVTVGGIDPNGKDAVNDLTYIMLRVAELLQTKDPSLNARYHYHNNTHSYRNRVAEVIAATKSVPAMHNDVVDISVLENQGVAARHAKDYAIIGCVELASAGRSYDASSAIIFNLVSVLELTLHNGKRRVTGDEQIGPKTGEPSQFKDFGEFWKAFKTQYAWLGEKAIELNEYFGRVHQEILPTPLLSSFFEGPMACGRDLIFGGALYNSSGAAHIGFADTVDSLNAIEKVVFIDKRFTFTELLNAIQADFVGHEILHATVLNKAPKYGTQDPLAVKNSQNLLRFLYDFYQGHLNYRGGKYRPAYWTMTNHAGQGKLSGALPNGRKAHMPFASGITPVSQMAGDLSACLKAVGGLDSHCIPGGEAFNLKFPAVHDKGDVEKLAQTIEAYFRLGGLHVQFNIISRDTLIDARKHPDKYPELLVRVSGYSAYFKDLSEAMKEEIITRTEYDIRTGQAVPLQEPDSQPRIVTVNGLRTSDGLHSPLRR